MLAGETANKLTSIKGNVAFFMLIVSMCPEMCKFCNEIALAGVSGSLQKLN